MGRLAEIILNQKPLTADQLAKLKASQAIKDVQKKEQQVKRATGADKVESEADKAVTTQQRVVATHHTDDLGDVQASLLQQASLSPALLAKVGRNEKLSPVEQKQLATFFKAVGWL